ncbi:hypothetical protein [Persephonella sp.]
MSVQELIDYLFTSSSIVFLMIQLVEKAAVALAATAFIIGAVIWLGNTAIGREQLSAEGLIRATMIPVLLMAFLYPSSVLSRNGESLAVATVRMIFDAGAYVADELSDKVGFYIYQHTVQQTATLNGYSPNVQPIHSYKFTELAKGYMDTAAQSAALLRKQLSEEMDTEIASQTWIEEHPTVMATMLGLLVGIGSKAAELAEAPTTVGQLLKKKMILLSLLSAGAGGAAKYAFFSMLMGAAMDIIWRFMTLLWVIKMATILILSPLAILAGLLAFNWGIGNIGRFFLNVLGIAITPVAMIAILGGSIYAYTMSVQIVSGMDPIFELIFRVFLSIAYPLIVAMTLLRVGEIISYIIGVSSFAIASVASVYTRPQQVVMDAMPR